MIRRSWKCKGANKFRVCRVCVDYNDTQSYPKPPYSQYTHSYGEQRSSYPDPPTGTPSHLNSASFAVNSALGSRPFEPLPAYSLLSYAPDTGPAGTRVHLRLASERSIDDCVISLVFGAATAPARVQQVPSSSEAWVYAVTCNAPEPAATRCRGNTVPVQLVVDRVEETGEIGQEELARLTVGEFDYAHDGASSGVGGGSSPAMGAGMVTRHDIDDQQSQRSAGSPPSRSVVLATGHSESHSSLVPRLPSLSGVGGTITTGPSEQVQQDLHRDQHNSGNNDTTTSNDNGDRHAQAVVADSGAHVYDYPHPVASPQTVTEQSPYENHFPTQATATGNMMTAAYRHALGYGGDSYGRAAAAQPPPPPPAPVATPTATLRSPTSGWSPYQPMDSSRPIITHSVIPRTLLPPHAVSVDPNAPVLRRTSTIPGASSTMSGGGPAAFGAYGGMFTHKAELKIAGKLEDMAYNWTAEEVENKRRIVLFTKEQRGAIITARFRAVSVNERPPNSTCVSCIWWAEREECYVTSVDTIMLLEALVGGHPSKFSVEEKNRIRRNLEGFHPITVSKSRADSESFFRTIMNFPQPRPRNIEKDVKVFPWKTLASSLTKIIGKYSASPVGAVLQNAAPMLPASPAHALLNGLTTPQYPLPPLPPTGAGYAYHHKGLESPVSHHAHGHQHHQSSHPSHHQLASPQRSMTSATSWPPPFTSTVPSASTYQTPSGSALRTLSPTRATGGAGASGMLHANSPLRLSTVGLPALGYGTPLPMPGLMSGSGSSPPQFQHSAAATASTTAGSRWDGFETYHAHQSHGHPSTGPFSAGYSDGSRG